MASDDEGNDDTSFDPTFATAGPRRSTFTPPPGSTATPPTGPAVHDDELAEALAADLGRISSGSTPVVVPGLAYEAEPVPEVEPDSVEDQAAPPLVLDVEADRDDEDVVADERPIYDLSEGLDDSATASPVDLQFAPPPAPETMAAPETIAAPESAVAPPPPWSDLPAPDPAQAVDLPEGPPQRPVRRSLPADQLLTLAEDQDAGTRIEQLEAQLRLREQEAHEFAAWEASMLALGTPDAAAAVEAARADFTDVVAPPTGVISLPGASAAPSAAEVAEVEPDPAPEAPVYVVDETVEPEVPAVAETVIEDSEPEAVVAAEEPLPNEPDLPEPEVFHLEQHEAVDLDDSRAPFVEPPTLTGSAPIVAAADYAVIEDDEAAMEVAEEPVPLEEPAVEEEAVEQPPAELPTWEIPAPSASWNPSAWEPSAGVEDEPVEAEPVVEAEPGIEEAAVEAEPAVEPEPEPEIETVSPFAPPPLVEPPPFAGPPILPSQAAAMPPLVDSVPSFATATDPEEAEEILEAEVIESGLADAPAPPPPAADEPFLFGGTPPTPPRVYSFEDLLSGANEVDEEPLLRRDPEPPVTTGATSIFIEPLVGDGVPTVTGSVAIAEPAYEEDLVDDVVDETDRVQTIVGAGGAQTLLPPPVSPPSGPISTVRIPEDATVIIDNEPVSPPAFAVEKPALEPTPTDQRVGRSARLFWLWFAANSSVLSLALGATIFSIGISLRQAIVAVLAGVALSFLPLGLTTLAGKRSGQPTMVVSRATFGHLGNLLPAGIALVTRVFWGAVLLWLIASSVAIVIVGAGLGSLGEAPILLISLAVAFVLAVVVAFLGYGLFARIQSVLSILSALLVIGFIALTASYVDIPQALTVGDGSWLRAVAGAVLVFSFVGLVWANSGADLARYQRPGTSGGGSMLWATFGATLPSFLLIAWGALLAASNENLARGLASSPLDTIAAMLPLWYPVPLIAATALSLLSGVVIVVYSGGFALQSLGLKVARQWSVLIVAGLLAVVAVLITLGVSGGMTGLFRDAATTLAVPTAAWAGIFAAETMIRNRRFESQSLVERGGVYQDWRWANVIGFVVITVIGFGLTTATVSWLSWQGYVFSAFGVPLDSDLAGTDLGVLVALVLGILVPIVTGIPTIRKQEETRVP